ncbi:tetratricopeptide repeat protein [Paenibacillus spongiae]|uniref:Tetratricopeptide repeat protein n=1 Tax=Paenibacillus spongiae TaxID=2909671 RepID=A0ABY5SJE6_9BACL|nr:tetratricopeptide repeat protein [Paenibacillus spongiae]UVI33764.1 tetratricopeptide repeat protein [Paenibacillus spongiae]
MPQDEFRLYWEKNEKFRLLEEVEAQYDEIKWQQAVQLYKDALEQQPNNPEYLHSYGYLLEMRANRMLREAAGCYQSGLESPLIQQQYAWMSGKLHAQLISVRRQLSENHQSIAFYKKLLTESPDDPEVYCFLIQCYLNADQVHEAGKVADAGLKLFPQYGTLMYYLGEVAARGGQTEEALRAWEQSALLDQQLIDGRFSRAFLFEREQRLAEAAEEWRCIVAFMGKYGFNDDFPSRELKRIEQALGK